MDPQIQMFLIILGLISSSGAFGAVIKMYGTQREQGGELKVLREGYNAMLGDHDRVVRLERDLTHLSTTVDTIGRDVKQCVSKLDEIRSHS